MQNIKQLSVLSIPFHSNTFVLPRIDAHPYTQSRCDCAGNRPSILFVLCFTENHMCSCTLIKHHTKCVLTLLNHFVFCCALSIYHVYISKEREKARRHIQTPCILYTCSILYKISKYKMNRLYTHQFHFENKDR